MRELFLQEIVLLLRGMKSFIEKCMNGTDKKKIELENSFYFLNSRVFEQFLRYNVKTVKLSGELTIYNPLKDLKCTSLENLKLIEKVSKVLIIKS